MSHSAFATGHLPDDKHDKAIKPDTASSSASTPSINSKTVGKKNEKTSKQMENKALIASYKWGGPIQGGVSDAVHILVRLLREFGISVYCTTLTATEEEIKEARRYGVELIPPSPVRKFKSRDEKPNPDWLYHHKDYFPNLKTLVNIRFLLGFGMITSEAAFEIEKSVFEGLTFYLINLYESDFITPVIANCGDRELEFRLECLTKEGQDSSWVFSSEGSIFAEYEGIYRECKSIKHSRLSTMIDEHYFQIRSPQPVDKSGKFQILSLFQEHELASLTGDSAIVKALNSVADSFHESKKSPLKWKILGVPKLCESTLLKCRDRNSKLHVLPCRMSSAKHFYNELGRTNLVLLHNFSVHYVNLTLAAMCAAVPIIIPEGSQSHELIEVHLPKYEESLVVDMSDSDKLQDRISKFLCSYDTTLTIAKEIRTAIKEKVKPELERINDDFFRVVEDDAKSKHGIILKREKQLAFATQAFQQIKRMPATLSKNSRSRNSQERDPGDMKVKVIVSEVVPESGRTVEEVERDFYESDEVKEKSEEIRQELDTQHDEMKVKDIGHESISYTMNCLSLDSLDFLRSEYEKGKLQDMMENKFLSEELLDKIGAFHLAIDTTIDYEEYFLCREELIEKYGMTKSSSKNLKRARDQQELKGEGDQMTKSKIPMIDEQQQQSIRVSENQKSEQQREAEHCVKGSLQECSSVPDKYIVATKNLSSNNIKEFGRHLLRSESELETIEFDCKDRGYNEVKYQIVWKWILRNGDKANDYWFANALRRVGLHTAADAFLSGRKQSVPSSWQGTGEAVREIISTLAMQECESHHTQDTVEPRPETIRTLSEDHGYLDPLRPFCPFLEDFT
ncbi:uncharacterized protein [Ptychodera flava]|uniref:uncharacterized protein n=1 Tax=Ptychodera flava TaxID=63121 RepID=UPI003969E27A